MPSEHVTPPRRARDQQGTQGGRGRPQRKRSGQRRPRQDASPGQQAQRSAARSAMLPAKINYPPELPVVERREDIAAATRDHQVVIVAGETGSGKTTQLPKIALELGRGIEGTIGHTQPRWSRSRIAAVHPGQWPPAILAKLGATAQELHNNRFALNVSDIAWLPGRCRSGRR